jgi:pimeloyl-ACP methyl ester carboxylesterase
METEITKVVSVDGISLAARVTGSGPPMVLVHGSTASKDGWALVEPILAERHTVWALDRRGRGQSGDAATHSLALEVEDVRSVVAAAGAGTHLVGHSYGAYCSLEAARLLGDLASLVIYEPPVHIERRAEPVRRAIGLLDAGDDEGALLVFLREVAGLSDDEVAVRRSNPEIWSRVVSAVPTCRREMAALASRPWDATRYASVDVPVLYLYGSSTDCPAYISIEEVEQAIPHAMHTALEGQRHIGFATDPEGFAAAVLEFTSSPRK